MSPLGDAADKCCTSPERQPQKETTSNLAREHFQQTCYGGFAIDLLRRLCNRLATVALQICQTVKFYDATEVERVGTTVSSRTECLEHWTFVRLLEYIKRRGLLFEGIKCLL